MLTVSISPTFLALWSLNMSVSLPCQTLPFFGSGGRGFFRRRFVNLGDGKGLVGYLGRLNGDAACQEAGACLRPSAPESRSGCSYRSRFSALQSNWRVFSVTQLTSFSRVPGVDHQHVIVVAQSMPKSRHRRTSPADTASPNTGIGRIAIRQRRSW